MRRRVGAIDPSRAPRRSTELTEGGTGEGKGKKRVNRTEGNFAILGPEKRLRC